jgi:hypothetical protein
MKSTLKLLILLAVIYTLYYTIYVFDFVRKYGTTPMRMRNTIAKEVLEDWKQNMRVYLWAIEPTKTDIQGLTAEQEKWINAIKKKANLSFIPIQTLYNNSKYKDQVELDLNFVAQERKADLLSDKNTLPRIKVILNKYGIDYNNLESKKVFNKQFSKLVR